uniref:Abhydrolase domain-containing protein 16A n=1 Tax=Aceria tosichella TaxID=561515 RepID=A0A6G1SF29_9ACAR
MASIKKFASFLFGPRLYSFYKLTGDTISSTTPAVLARSHKYQPSSLEAASDYIIRISRIITYFGAYVSPVIFTYLVYKRNVPGSFFNSLDQSALLRLFATAVSILFGSFCVRGFARYSNPEYAEFLKALETAHKTPTPSNKRILVHFNADFSAYPIDFKWSEARDQRLPVPYKKSLPADSLSNRPPPILENIPFRLPLDVLLNLIMKTVGRRLIYPGSLSVLQAVMEPAISAGRSKLIEEHDGIRNKLEACDGNSIDTMFVDRRGTTPNGDYLVIGCEGNGGFYELGTIMTPLEAGYSVLGWNHPGFGGSTGSPYPDQDVAAVDVVIKFAMDKLQFAPSQIIIYGWSIGGFTATWAGMRHPNIHGVVIDASFDHILPLARNIFPGILYPFIELAIRQHFDLDNSRHLEHYAGPVLLIRRSQDEVISTDPYNSPPHNRANYLLADLLKSRFPRLMDDRAIRLLKEYLGGNERYQMGVLRRYSVNEPSCLRLLLDYFHTHRTAYPVEIGPDLDITTRDQLVLYLASKHLIDYDSVHCAPLPGRYLQKPWNLINIALSASNL